MFWMLEISTGWGILMENKLLELKEQFCKWYCPNKNGLDYGGIHFDHPCDFCMISEYITFIRDEI